MKKSVTTTVLFAVLLALPVFADVYTRLHQVSNAEGVLVVDVQAMSDDGAPLISLYRGAFRISETLEQRVTAVEFKHLQFERPAYIQEYGYSTPYRKVTWIYTYDKNSGEPYAAVDTDWLSVLRVTITYNQSNEKATLSWAGSPHYLVKDDQDKDITGDYYPISPDLQDFPLPVQLSAFAAKTLENGEVYVTWRTESELNNLGFNLYRSSNETEGFVRVNEVLIEGQGTSSTAQDYSFMDKVGGDWYLVENISIEGLSTFDGPVQATASSIIKSEASPATFALITNYPNPFNPSTEIRYTLTTAAAVELTVFSIRGKMTKQLIAAHQAPGAYSVVWDGLDAQGKRVDSGVYICEFRLDNQVYYHKMTLIK